MPVPRPRSAMRKIREILRLALGEGLSRRATGAATGLPYTTVSDHLVRAVKAGLGWPLPDGMDDAQLEARLFAKAEPPPSASRPLPDWPTVHRELRRKGMTLQLLTATSTPSSAATTGPGSAISTWSCARSTAPAR